MPTVKSLCAQLFHYRDEAASKRDHCESPVQTPPSSETVIALLVKHEFY